MTRYRINAQGRVMAYSLGMWTTLPPRKARSVLFAMSRKQLIGLINVMAVVAVLPNLIAAYV